LEGRGCKGEEEERGREERGNGRGGEGRGREGRRKEEGRGEEEGEGGGMKAGGPCPTPKPYLK